MDKKIIAVYGLTNTASVNIYEIQHGIEDTVLAGINDQEPEECIIQYNNEDEPFFILGELEIPLNECMRV
ncbi:hypothetical protein IEN91_04785 [Bacillus velezensis]|uniref:hypothetical protein n=1 Tax=Bacillus velezensis TaxID=492670 RepID=UPI0018C6FE66|nr:hypothetical protein [Bacillus velezensis]QPK89760.1 hypothetical protein IEN91_04785 [Bacillus velezensis]